MTIRGIRWPFIVMFLLALSLITLAYSAGPVFPHQEITAETKDNQGPLKDASTQREFTEIYNRVPDKSTTPKIFSNAGTPSVSPAKLGDLFINTSTGKVYISTATASSLSWAILN